MKPNTRYKTSETRLAKNFAQMTPVARIADASQGHALLVGTAIKPYFGQMDAGATVFGNARGTATDAQRRQFLLNGSSGSRRLGTGGKLIRRRLRSGLAGWLLEQQPITLSMAVAPFAFSLPLRENERVARF